MLSSMYLEGFPLPLKFQRNKERLPNNSTLQNFLKQLGETTQDNDTKKVIKEIVDFFIENKENKSLSYEITDVIIRLFTKFNNKKVLKKYIQGLVVKKKLTHDIVKNTTQCILDKIKTEMACDLNKCSEFLYFLSVIQNSPDYDYDLNFRELFPVYISLFNSYSMHVSQVQENLTSDIEELNVVINAVLKQILPVFVKNVAYFEKIKEQYIPSLLMNSYMLLSNENIEFDIRMKVCLIFMHSFNIMEIGKASIAQLISKTGSPLSLSLNSFEGSKTPKDHFIIVYSAILSVLPEDRLVSEKVDGKALLYVLYEGILDTAKSNPGHSSIIVESSRVLAQVAKYMKNIPTNLITPLFLESLFYVSSHTDHFIDTVRNYSKIFFEELVRLAAHHHDNEYTELTDLLISKIHDLPEASTMRFLAYENVAKFYGCEFLLKKFELLPLMLLESIDKPSMTDQVQKTYQVLLEKSFNASTEETRNNWVKAWVLPVLLILKSRRDKEGFCQKVISGAFKLCPSILREIFPSNYVGSVDESKVLLNCLRDARKNGIELSSDNDNNLLWRGLIDKQRLDMYMIHQNEEIRVLTLATVTESLKTTELFLDWEFTFLLSYISYNITTQRPSVRKQVVTYYKKVLARFDAGLKVIERNITSLTKHLENNPTDKEQKKHLLLYQELKKSYRRFISILVRVVIGNLSYDSNFPRRSTSLELLLVIHDILTPDEWKSCWNEDDVKNSHNIIFDTYENNKKMIVKLLKTLPPNYLGFTNVSFTFKYMQRSFNLALDVKPSKTLSAAYLFEVCSYSPYFYDIVHCECGEDTKKLNDPNLDMIVVLTKKFLNQSSEIKLETIGVAKTAVYGLILSIRHLLESRNIEQHNDTYRGIFDHLVTTCFGISEKMMPVVCNPSPEGYLPDNFEELCENDESPDAQKVLVYAWRTMKEMTLLLAEIVKQTVKLQDELAMLSEKTLKKIGEFFVDVFIQSKHRGVFEQAYVGFSIVCDSFWKSNNKNIVQLPAKWLTEALNLCTGKKHSDDLCPTRRSAGLPFLILSIITTEGNNAHFHSTMSTLLETVESNADCSAETRMHCLNVLRAIYRHSKLGELVASYIVRGVILAIEGFKSEAWGVRNSSTLLFAALMTRIFGVQRTSDCEQLCIKNKLTVKVFFLRYQELYKYLLDTLSEECHNKCSLVLQPILMILSRLYPSNFENGPHKMAEYLPHIDVCLGNTSYRVREMAAKASVALIDTEDVTRHFDKCFAKMSDPKISDNECHGTLLQMYYVMKNLNVKDVPLLNYLKLSAHIWENDSRQFSHMTVNLYLELITLFLYCSPDFDDLEWLRRIIIYLSTQEVYLTTPLTSLGNFTVTRTILAYYIIINKLEETDITYSTVTNEIMAILYGPPTLMKKFCLEFLICLNHTHTKIENAMFSSAMERLGNSPEEGSDIYLPNSEMEQHPLLMTGDLELNSDIETLVSTFSRSSVENILKEIHPFLKTFLIEELKTLHYIHKEDRVLLFLLVNYYPCAIKCLRLSKQETLNTLVGYCDCDNEELISAVISCISVFLTEVDYNLLRYDKLLEVLSKSASPAAACFRRLAVCDFLCKNTQLYCSAEPVLQGDQLCTVLNIVMVLLEDEDMDVRNAMSNYEDSLRVRIKINNTTHTIPGYKWSVVPEKAKEDLVHLITVLMPQEKAVCMIFSWACRHIRDPCCETQEIFERGGLNQYAENTPLIEICSRVLTKMLWTLPEGVSYESKSIFLEEQTQVVTATLLNSLMKYDSPMMITKTKMSVICGLKSLYKYLEQSEVSGNFANNFRTYLNDTILTHLTNHLELGDLFCVKKIIRKLYEPVFRQRR